MTRLPRLDRILVVVGRGAPLVGGIAAVAGAVGALLAQDWMTALWAGIAAVWAFLWATHSCPAPESTDRGAQAVRFCGGPEDGAVYFLPLDRAALYAELNLTGADYTITTVEHTAFRADFVQLADRDDRADR